MQQTWPIDKDKDRVGLLPDSFALRPQIRNDAAINPATLLACAVRFYHQPPVYDLYISRVFAAEPIFIHAPGAITEVTEGRGRISFRVSGWPVKPYFVLISGLQALPG